MHRAEPQNRICLLKILIFGFNGNYMKYLVWLMNDRVVSGSTKNVTEQWVGFTLICFRVAKKYFFKHIIAPSVFWRHNKNWSLFSSSFDEQTAKFSSSIFRCRQNWVQTKWKTFEKKRNRFMHAILMYLHFVFATWKYKYNQIKKYSTYIQQNFSRTPQKKFQ